MRKHKLDKICKHCNSPFKTMDLQAKYCSIKCARAFNKAIYQKHEIKIHTCLTCNKSFTKKDHPGRPKKYCSQKCAGIGKGGKNNINWKNSVGVRGPKHHSYKEVSVTMSALHVYIRRRLPKTEKCQECGIASPYDLANISQEYKRDLSDWEWLCRRCHMKKDGRVNNLIKISKSFKEKACKGCGVIFMADKTDPKYCTRVCYLKYFKPTPRKPSIAPEEHKNIPELLLKEIGAER